MKFVILQITFLLVSLFAKSQEFKKDTMVIGDVRLVPGDTIFMGYGSGINKQFVFIHWRPTVLTYEVGAGPEPLGAQFANGFIIYAGGKRKKALGKEYFDPVYLINGTKYRVMMQVGNALGVSEIKRFGLKR